MKNFTRLAGFIAMLAPLTAIAQGPGRSNTPHERGVVAHEHTQTIHERGQSVRR